VLKAARRDGGILTEEPVRKTPDLDNIPNIVTVEATIVGHEDGVPPP